MDILFGFGVYFMIWWVTLFVTLPIGIRPRDSSEVVDGTDPGAPLNPSLPKRVFWNTILSGVIFFLWWLTFFGFGLTLDDLGLGSA